MKLEDQVAPLALAQRMKELGFPQDTCFSWADTVLVGRLETGVHETSEIESMRDHAMNCAAPTVAEMGEWAKDHFGAGSFAHRGPEWDGEFWHVGIPRDPFDIEGATEAEARARLLIALAEAGALDVTTLK